MPIQSHVETGAQPRRQAPLARSLVRPTVASHLRVLWAILKLDVLHLIRYPMSLAMLPFTILTFLIPIYFTGLAFSGDDGRPDGFAALTGTDQFFSFAVTGGILMIYTVAVFFGIASSLKEDMQRGTLESNWITPAPRLLLLIGRSLASVVQATLQVLLILLATIPFGVSFGGDLWRGLGLVFLPSLIGLYGIGFMLAGVAFLAREVNAFLDLGQFALNTLTGQSYPVTILPRWLLAVSLAIPLTYGVDTLRSLLFGSRPLLPLGQSLTLLWGSAAVLVAVGLVVFVAAERKARMRGTIGMH